MGPFVITLRDICILAHIFQQSLLKCIVYCHVEQHDKYHFLERLKSSSLKNYKLIYV